MHDPSFASRATGPVPPLAMSRRDLLMGAAVAGVAALGSHLEAQDQHAMTPLPRNASGEGGLLFPQQNRWRNVFDLSGLWEFQLDPETKGEADGWFRELPKPRPIAVPCSWNDLFDEARDYLDLAWYLREFDSPADWRGSSGSSADGRRKKLSTGRRPPGPRTTSNKPPDWPAIWSRAGA